MMPSPILLALLVIPLTIAIALVAYHASAGLLGRRREAWEVERAEWRRWMTRP